MRHVGTAFRVWPKRVRRLAGQVIAPEMVVTVVTQVYATTPFYRGIEDVRVMYLNIYRIDIKQMGCTSGDFEFEIIDK